MQWEELCFKNQETQVPHLFLLLTYIMTRLKPLIYSVLVSPSVKVGKWNQVISKIISFSDILWFEDLYWNENFYLKYEFTSYSLSSSNFLTVKNFYNMFVYIALTFECEYNIKRMCNDCDSLAVFRSIKLQHSCQLLKESKLRMLWLDFHTC